MREHGKHGAILIDEHTTDGIHQKTYAFRLPCLVLRFGPLKAHYYPDWYATMPRWPTRSSVMTSAGQIKTWRYWHWSWWGWGFFIS